MPYDKVTPNTILAATKKLLDIRGGTADPDDRDSLANQTFHGPEDFFAERIDKDAGGIGRKILWKSTNKGRLAGVPSGALTPQMNSVLLNSGMGQPLEEINPIEIMDNNLRVMRLGEGGIPSTDAIPDEARNVHPSQFGFIDMYRGPESEKLGVDTRLAMNTFKGSDKQIYTELTNVRNGKTDMVSAPKASESVIAFPGEMARKGNKVRAMVRGKLGYVDKREVDFELPHATEMFNVSVNLSPAVSTMQGNRAFMSGKIINQALPIRGAEAPLVQTQTKNPEESFEQQVGSRVGAVRADKPGVVTSTQGGKVKVRNHDGSTSEYDMYESMPLNRKTYLTNTPMVRPGDPISKGSLIAKSNFTDDEGTLAMGKNLRVAWMPFKGLTYEDAYVISESAAKKMESEHMYTPSLEMEKDVETGLKKFVSLFPKKFTREQLERMDDDGVVTPGTKINPGDPMILAVGKMPEKAEGQWSMIARGPKRKIRDRTVTWDHDFAGEVTDVVRGKEGIQVAVRAYTPMQDGDKIVGRHGDKGVVTVVPDDKMPRDKEGVPFDVIQNPLTLPTRMNPSQVFEMQLAKVARKTGRPVKIPAVMEESVIDYVEKELRKHGLKDTESIVDPENDRDIPEVMTGEKFFMKLHHTAEGKSSARETAGYTAEEVPSRGGKEGSKTIANLGMNALISHGATSVIRDSKLVRGQKNDDYWRTFRQGFSPSSPQVPLVYKKFLTHLRGAGINLKKQGNDIHIMALTDKDVDKVSHGEITSADTVKADDLSPIKGGLFDRSLTGGIGGNNWTHIKLAEPMPAPVMEEPIRRLLGLTKKDLDAVISGRKQINGKSGGAAIHEALARINIDQGIDLAKSEVKNYTGAKRDAAIKKLRYLAMCKEKGLHPQDFVITKVPVIPPNYRPISRIKDNVQIVSDANYLYQDLLENNDALKAVTKELGSDQAADERLNVYKSAKAVAGLGDPVHPKLQEQRVGGLLKYVFGRNSPKFGAFQRKVIGMNTDFAARGVITPNPSLDMDHVGMPEDQAWKLYRPFVIRRLTRKGTKSTEAAELVDKRDERASRELIKEMDSRPVIVNRAPTLHRYGMMAAFPVLIKGKTLQVSPIVTGGFGADFDGDTMSYHVPVSEDAVKEAKKKMLPSKNLVDVRNFDVHYVPSQEYLLGLYQASTKKGNGEGHVFNSKAEAIKAYQRGEVKLGDSVTIRD